MIQQITSKFNNTNQVRLLLVNIGIITLFNFTKLNYIFLILRDGFIILVLLYGATWLGSALRYNYVDRTYKKIRQFMYKIIWAIIPKNLKSVNIILLILLALSIISFIYTNIVTITIILLIIIAVSVYCVWKVKATDEMFNLGLYHVRASKRDVETVTYQIVPFFVINKEGAIYKTKKFTEILHSMGDVVDTEGKLSRIGTDGKYEGFQLVKNLIKTYLGQANEIKLALRKEDNQIKFIVTIPKKYEEYFKTYIYKNLESFDLHKIEPKTYQFSEKFKIKGDWRDRIRTFKNNTFNPQDTIIALLENEKNNFEIEYSLIPLTKHYNSIIGKETSLLPTETNGGTVVQGQEAAGSEKYSSALFKFTGYIKSDEDIKNISEYKNTYSLVAEQDMNYITFDFIEKAQHRQSVISVSELWALYNFESESSAIETTKVMKMKYPTELINRQDFDLILGTHTENGKQYNVGIVDKKTRTYHTSIVGKPGSGKTEFLKNYMVQDIKKKVTTIFVDYKGMAAPSLMRSLDPEDWENTIYMDVTSQNCPQMAILDGDPDVIVETIDLFKEASTVDNSDAYGHTLRRNLLALIKIIQRKNIKSLRSAKSLITDIMTNPKDAKILLIDNDEDIRAFGATIVGLNKSSLVQHLNSTMNKMSKLFLSERIEDLIDNPNSILNFHDEITKGKNIIINLPQADLKEEERQILSMFYVSKIMTAIFKQNEGSPLISLVIDEAHSVMNVLPEKFKTMFAKIRQFNVSLTIANQMRRQLDETLMEEILGNITTDVILPIKSDREADIIMKEFGFDPKVIDKRIFKFNERSTGYIRMADETKLFDPVDFTFTPIPMKHDKFEVPNYRVEKFNAERLTLSASVPKQTEKKLSYRIEI